MKPQPSRKDRLAAENDLFRQQLEFDCENLRPAAELVEKGFSIVRVLVKTRAVVDPVTRLLSCRGWTDIPRAAISAIRGWRR